MVLSVFTELCNTAICYKLLRNTIIKNFFSGQSSTLHSFFFRHVLTMSASLGFISPSPHPWFADILAEILLGLKIIFISN